MPALLEQPAQREELQGANARRVKRLLSIRQPCIKGKKPAFGHGSFVPEGIEYPRYLQILYLQILSCNSVPPVTEVPTLPVQLLSGMCKVSLLQNNRIKFKSSDLLDSPVCSMISAPLCLLNFDFSHHFSLAISSALMSSEPGFLGALLQKPGHPISTLAAEHHFTCSWERSAHLEVGQVLVHLGLLLCGRLLRSVHGQADLRFDAPPHAVLLILLPHHRCLLQPAPTSCFSPVSPPALEGMVCQG